MLRIVEVLLSQFRNYPNDEWTELVGLIRIWFLSQKFDYICIIIELWKPKINAVKIEVYLKKLKTILRTYWNDVGLFIKLIIHILDRIILQTVHHITIFFSVSYGIVIILRFLALRIFYTWKVNIGSVIWLRCNYSCILVEKTGMRLMVYFLSKRPACD